MIAVHLQYFLFALKKLKRKKAIDRNKFFNDQIFYMKTFLKIILALAVMVVALPEKSNAQVLIRQVTSSPYKDSVTAAGTKYFNFFSTPSGLQGMSFSAIKATTGGGTVDSYVILQVRTDTMPGTATSHWEDYINPSTGTRDTLFMTNLTTVQGKLWAVPVQYFNGIRAKVVSTGAQKFYVYYSRLMR